MKVFVSSVLPPRVFLRRNGSIELGAGFGRPQQTTLVGEAEPAIMPSELDVEELAAEMRRRLRELEDGDAA
jgi:hypothetical protein